MQPPKPAQAPPAKDPTPISAPVPDKTTDPDKPSSSTGSGSESEDEGGDSPDPEVSRNLPISPSEDVKTYGSLIKTIAARLGLSIAEPHTPVADAIFDIVLKEASAPVFLPLASVFLQTIQQTWEKPSSAPASSKRVNHMYQVQEQSATFLYSHPKPNSLVVSSSVKGKHCSSPPDTDGKTIDS